MQRHPSAMRSDQYRRPGVWALLFAAKHRPDPLKHKRIFAASSATIASVEHWWMGANNGRLARYETVEPAVDGVSYDSATA